MSDIAVANAAGCPQNQPTTGRTPWSELNLVTPSRPTGRSRKANQQATSENRTRETRSGGRFGRLDDFTNQMRAMDESRSERIAALREAIAAGLYELDEAIEGGLRRAVEEVVESDTDQQPR